MKKIIAPLLLLSGLCCVSCTRLRGEGPLVNEQRYTPAFTAVRTACDAEVFIRPDTVLSVELSGQQNVLQQLQTTVHNGELTIDFDYRLRLGSHDRIQVTIGCPDLRKVSISGSGTTRIGAMESAYPLSLQISGSGNIEAASLRVPSLEAGVSGSGDIRVLAGTATSVMTKISGSGSVDISQLSAQRAEVRSSGSGDTRLAVSESLDVQISGSGDVYYWGNPRISTGISGSGKLVPRR